MDTWAKTRQQATWRRRRIIMNNDGNDTFSAPEATPESFWAQRCSGLEGSHVDAIFYCTTGNFAMHSHDSRCAKELYDVYDIPLGEAGIFVSSSSRSHHLDFISQGRDNLQLIVDFCHANEIEAFWSLRMNDIHDNWYPSLQPEFKRRHPEFLLFQPEDVGRPRQGLVEPHMNATALDYEHQEVRDLQFAIIEDVCQRYDIDGIELDFMRNPIFFRPTLDGLSVEPEHIDTMSSFMRRVRAMTERVGQTRGRPLLVAARVPNTPACGLAIGLDLDTWLAEDLVDLIVACLEHAPFTGDISETVTLAHARSKPVYACLSLGGDTERWTGAAMNAWNAGADGIYTFNEFNPHLPIWHIVGEPQKMTGLDKIYAADRGSCRTWEHVVPQEGRLPVCLPDGEERCIRLPVGDDVAAAAARGDTPYLVMSIKVEHLTWRDQVEFRLNGTLLDTEVYYANEGVSPAACGTFMFRARPELACVQQGDNTFQAVVRRHHPPPAESPALSQLELKVQYGQQ